MHSIAPAPPSPADPPALVSLSDRLRGRMGELGPLMRNRALYPVFQPIANIHDGAIYAHEALIRGPVGTPLHSADALFQLARQDQVVIEFELHCVELALAQWGRLNQPGRLFVNISADALVHMIDNRARRQLLDYVRGLGISARMLVFEITEHERVSDMA